jgi:hypothetical protein
VKALTKLWTPVTLFTAVTYAGAIGAYVTTVAEGESLAEPAWPNEPFGKLLALAFAGRMVDRPDHPLINRLRGLL